MIGKLNEIEIEALLERNAMGRLGCTNGDSVYVVPMSYIYHNNQILAHSTEGKKIEFMRSHPKVCFEVDEVENYGNWKSVIVWGNFEEVEDELEKQEHMELMVEKMMKLKVPETASPPHAFAERPRPHQPGYVQVVIWRIAINKKSGRFEKNI
jgi:nitroimidazol reductase NimA-like FMN-containing flavoprotein (pyridoxamine 5'-phosphate oxidase superfamily)